MSQDVAEDRALSPAERFAAMSLEDQEAVLAGKPVDGDLGDDEYDAGATRPEDQQPDEPEHIPHFVVDPDDEDVVGQVDMDEFQFTLGRIGDPEDEARVLVGRRPKTTVLMDLAMVDPKTTDLATMARVINTFLDHVLDKPSRDYVRGQFNDPDSSWDIDMLVPVIHACKARWYGGRPTGRATGSSGSPSSRGKRSTGRSPSRGRPTRKR